MATLYVQEQGSMLRKKDHQLLVTREGQTLQAVPLARLDQVFLMGRGVQISTALLVDLLEKGIPITLTNQRGNKHYGTLAAGVSRFGELRTQQMLFMTSERALGLAQAMISAKLSNQRALLLGTGWASAPASVAQIDAALLSLSTAASIDSVRGYEGAAAAAYFGAWRVALPNAWHFQGRAFYPPPDPINAMLSFGYTLALHDVLTAVQITGLDPYLGSFHVVEAGRPSLGLDLLEEFRPLVVDRLVLDLLHSMAISREHFERPPQLPDAVYLNAEGRALFVERYEALLNSPVMLPSREQTSMRRVILLQAQALARVLRGEQERYAGFSAA